MSNAMTQYAEELGLTSEDLVDTVAQIHADRAGKTNDDGLSAQIEFLFSDYCDNNPNTMRALLAQIVKEKQAD